MMTIVSYGIRSARTAAAPRDEFHQKYTMLCFHHLMDFSINATPERCQEPFSVDFHPAMAYRKSGSAWTWNFNCKSDGWRRGFGI
ncbi:MAG: hypothetical protein ACOZF0_20400 [Thermodesulfobacteriota bacterium]